MVAIEHPALFLQYFFSITGNVISGNLKSMLIPLGVFIVTFIVVGFFIVWKRKQIQQFLFPLALALNSTFIAGSIAIGRVGLGVEQGLASRYITYVIYVVVGACLLWMQLQDKQSKPLAKKGQNTHIKHTPVIKYLRTTLLVVVTASIPFTTAEGLQMGKIIRADRDYSAYVLKTIAVQPDGFAIRLHPVANTVKHGADYLQQHKLSVFHDTTKYEVPDILLHDSLGQLNNAVLQLPQQPMQFAPDFMVVIRPAVTVQYKDSVRALYADVDGQVFPLYYQQETNTQLANPTSVYNVSAITNRMLTPGLHTLKYKALRPDMKNYYIIDVGLVFEGR
jgi:hypothetical protein